MSPYTPEEVIARDYLVQEQPELIINIIDATNLERNLYLTTQLLDLDIPMIIGLNMMDVIKKKEKINLEKLSYGLGVPVLPISVLKSKESKTNRKDSGVCKSGLLFLFLYI